MVFIEALFWFVLAFILAAVEIEIEGKYGWAEKLPTWYRKNGYTRIFSIFGVYRPLTGYHLFMKLFIIVVFHAGFFLGLQWTLTKELMLLAIMVFYFIMWDFLWFVLNPNYTIKNYSKEKIWWFNKSYWIFGLFPQEYLIAFILSLIFSFIASKIANNSLLFINHLYILGLLILFTFLAIIFIAPSYHKWYKSMRKRDDRKISEIFHRK